jgi:hypothetical protein
MFGNEKPRSMWKHALIGAILAAPAGALLLTATAALADDSCD